MLSVSAPSSPAGCHPSHRPARLRYTYPSTTFRSMRNPSLVLCRCKQPGYPGTNPTIVGKSRRALWVHSPGQVHVAGHLMLRASATVPPNKHHYQNRREGHESDCTPGLGAHLHLLILDSLFHVFNYSSIYLFTFTIQKHGVFCFFKPNKPFLIFWRGYAIV